MSVAQAQNFALDWFTFDGGGGTSTLGQPDAGGAMSGGGYSLNGGFWSLISVVPAQILGPVLSGTSAVFTFGTVSNRTYTVEWTAELSPANWQVWTNLTGTGAKLPVAVPPSGAARRFFRVRQP